MTDANQNENNETGTPIVGGYLGVANRKSWKSVFIFLGVMVACYLGVMTYLCSTNEGYKNALKRELFSSFDGSDQNESPQDFGATARNKANNTHSANVVSKNNSSASRNNSSNTAQRNNTLQRTDRTSDTQRADQRADQRAEMESAVFSSGESSNARISIPHNKAGVSNPSNSALNAMNFVNGNNGGSAGNAGNASKASNHALVGSASGSTKNTGTKDSSKVMVCSKKNTRNCMKLAQACIQAGIQKCSRDEALGYYKQGCSFNDSNSCFAGALLIYRYKPEGNDLSMSLLNKACKLGNDSACAKRMIELNRNR